MFEKPIILIGTHRSGTTYLGDILARHTDLTYWPEPKYIWMMGNERNPHDALDEAHATDALNKKIRKEIEKYLNKNNGQRLLEKTPSNCLRIKFIHKIFPQAHFVHILRDGRSVLSSTENVIDRGISPKATLRRASQIPVRQWPVYSLQAANKIFPFLSKKKPTIWGPRPPGWQQWVTHDKPTVILAKQWASTVTAALDDSSVIPDGQYHRIHYDDLVLNPRDTLVGLLKQMDLKSDEKIVEYVVSTVRPDRIHAWKEQLDRKDLVDLKPILQPVLDRIGYAW